MSTTDKNNSRDSSALVGALVADAAAMGLHWLYDQEQIARVATTGDVLFRSPDTQVYQGHRGYFAHAQKRAGDFSHYGEALMLFADLLDSDQPYSVAGHRELFLERFGPGGSFIGYADRPTKALLAKILVDGDDLPEVSGSDDDQLPAIIPVPVFFAAGLSEAELLTAVQVSADNAVAVEGAAAVFTCLRSLASGADVPTALQAGAARTSGELASLLQQAMQMPDYNPLAAANQFGMPCHIPQGLPVVWHMLNRCNDYERLVRDNVLCGGDSCGRAMALGAIASCAHGVPHSLCERVANKKFMPV